MRTVASTPRVLSFARLHFRIAISALLDDPEGHSFSDVPAMIDDYRALAHDLGLDFDKLVEDQGTHKEIERLIRYDNRLRNLM